VNGRNAISWTMKFELDIWYIDNVSFATDCKVMFLTLKKVIKKEGINQAQQATVEAFKGNN
jgi:lipopolysaccharide/colanic/teichoic acid biosynthesis glycosyltransferase